MLHRKPYLLFARERKLYSRDDNARTKKDETPEAWKDQPAKRSPKDTDAQWTKKHGKSHHGFKTHVNVDRRHKLVRARTRIGLKNLAYNMRRLVQLERLAMAGAP